MGHPTISGEPLPLGLTTRGGALPPGPPIVQSGLPLGPPIVQGGLSLGPAGVDAHFPGLGDAHQAPEDDQIVAEGKG